MGVCVKPIVGVLVGVAVTVGVVVLVGVGVLVEVIVGVGVDGVTLQTTSTLKHIVS